MPNEPGLGGNLAPGGSQRAVFLSYASQDAQAARRICDALRVAGIEVWFDQSELRGGDAWDQKIRREIRECALFVPVISANTAARPEGYFRLEWSLAEQRSQMIARNKPYIVPVCVDATPDTGADVPESFLRVQWTRLPGGEAPPAFCQRLATLLGVADAPAAALARGIPAPAIQSALTRRFPVWLWVAVAATAAAMLAAGVIAWQPWKLLAPQADRTAATAGRAGASGIAPEKSIAVLPFVDLSEKRDQEYFADGLAEELLNLLARVPELKVPARSSSFYFKGRDERIATIARELGVAHVLEGSVRRAGDTVRVDVQLIRADSGYHVWSSTYDRGVKDIFKVQDEISAAVVEALKLKLVAPAPSITEQRTTSPEAHDQYLLGEHDYRLSSREGYLRSIAAFRRAIELDPNFGLAYAGLAVVEYLEATDFEGTLTADVLRRVLASADRAVALAPATSSVYSARGFLRQQAMWDWAGAQADLDKAIVLDPNDASTLRRRGFLHSSLGQHDAALASERRAVEIDPLNANSVQALGEAFAEVGREAEARTAFERTRELSPGFRGIDANIGDTYLREGQAAAAKRACKRGMGIEERACLAVAEHALGDERASRALFDELTATASDTRSAVIAAAFVGIGDRERAFTWLERAYRGHDRLLAIAKSDPHFKALHGDPRFTALLRRMNLP